MSDASSDAPRTLVFNGWAAGPETWALTSFRRDWTFSYVEQMEGLPERVLSNFASAVLVGFSMGGMMALKVALDHPEKVRGLVLISTTPRMLEEKASAWTGMSERRLAALRLGTRLVYANDPSPLYDSAQMDRGLEYLRNVDLRARLSSLGDDSPLRRCPVRVFQSERDGIVRPTNAAFFARVFPQATVTMVPGNEHVLPITIPEAIDTSLRQILT